MKTALALCTLAIGFNALAGNKLDVIYGDDNRHDVYDYADRAFVDLSRSTVALVRPGSLTARGNSFTLPTTPWSQDAGMCTSERFSSQPSPAFCSGFLVAPDKIVTAGHCVDSVAACANVKFVFDFKMLDENRANTTFTRDQIFSCARVLGQAQVGNGVDYAVIKLDRPVVGRTPLRLSNNRNLRMNDDVLVIGHPAGLPLKITDGARVRTVRRNEGYFMANLDTYGGNSGSAVFNVRTREVEGILVRGENDYESNGSCRTSFEVANDAGRGEDVTLISRIREDGFQNPAPSTTTPAPATGPVRYVWLDSDMTCNEFRGGNYIREVANSLCGRPDSGPAAGVRYVWLDSDMTCNEFRGNNFIREVANSLCGRSATAGVRYVWLNSDMTCNEFRGDRYIREVANSLCGH